MVSPQDRQRTACHESKPMVPGIPAEHFKKAAALAQPGQGLRAFTFLPLLRS